MRKITAVSVTALLSLAANLALAAGSVYQAHNHEPWSGQRHDDRDDRTVAAPEIDPGQAMGALALLGGTVAILRGYRRKK